MSETLTGVTIEDLSVSQSAQMSFIEQARDKKTVPIMVHPWFTDYDSNHGDKNLPEYRARRDKFITACTENNVPLVIFEEAHLVDSIRDRIRAESGSVYVVPTELADPTPTGNFSEDNFVDLLKQANVAHVAIGGEFFRVYHPVQQKTDRLKGIAQEISKVRNTTAAATRWVNQNISLGGCVGYLADTLFHKQVDVTVLPITSPAKVPQISISPSGSTVA